MPSFQGTLNKLMNGRVKSPTRATAERVARHFDIPIEAVYDPRVADQVATERGLLDDQGDRKSSGAAPLASKEMPLVIQERPAGYHQPHPLGDALTSLAAAIAALPRIDRAQLQPLLAMLTSEPEARREICERAMQVIAPNLAYQYQYSWEDMARQVAARTGTARLTAAQFVALVDEAQRAHVHLHVAPSVQRTG